MSEREPGDGSGERPERDPVNHRPPEEWRPGDPGDPGSPMGGGGRPPGEPPHEPLPHRGTGAGRSGEPGELSEGPSGPGGSGPEQAGYAPGYGDYPSAPVDYGDAGGYVPGTGPPPVRPTPWGKILGIGCGVLLLLLLLLGGCATVLLFTAGDDVSTAPARYGSGAEEAESDAEPPSEATLAASTTDFRPGALYLEGEYTSVLVEVTNDGDQALAIDPLHFTIVDDDGVGHDSDSAIAMDSEELAVQTLEPGQSTQGAITVEGEVVAERVVFDPYFTAPMEAPVS